MLKVNTITCHDVYNAGASLQAYAFVTYLRESGYDAKIIDYKPSYLKHYRLTGINNSRYDKPVLRELYQVAKFPGRLRGWIGRKRRAYDCFTAALPLTRRYRSFEELKADPPDADIYFAGSDQIWNTAFPNGNDPAFYLDFVPMGKIRAAYAASFATDDIAEERKPQVRQWLLKFDALSVRESSGVRIIRELGLPGAAHVCDPVFLLSRAHWEGMTKPLAIEKPYLLVYDFDHNPRMKDFCLKTARKNGWKIYSLFHNDYSDRCFDREGPVAFLSLLLDADYVVSNSFHALAFSLIFEKQFAVFRRYERINTRMEDLVTLLNLPGTMEPDPDSAAWVDYKAVGLELAGYIDRSKAYITDVMERIHQHD